LRTDPSFIEHFLDFFGIIPMMDTSMFKEALICGFGMVLDISGTQLFRAPVNNVTVQDSVASDWQAVGISLTKATNMARPEIEAEAAKQLDLKLG
jgi:hypothetical protein